MDAVNVSPAIVLHRSDHHQQKYKNNSFDRLSLLWRTELIPSETTAITRKRMSAKNYMVKGGNPSTSKIELGTARIHQLLKPCLAVRQSPLPFWSDLRCCFRFKCPECVNILILRRLASSMWQCMRVCAGWWRNSGGSRWGGRSDRGSRTGRQKRQKLCKVAGAREEGHRTQYLADRTGRKNKPPPASWAQERTVAQSFIPNCTP